MVFQEFSTTFKWLPVLTFFQEFLKQTDIHFYCSITFLIVDVKDWLLNDAINK